MPLKVEASAIEDQGLQRIFGFIRWAGQWKQCQAWVHRASHRTTLTGGCEMSFSYRLAPKRATTGEPAGVAGGAVPAGPRSGTMAPAASALCEETPRNEINPTQFNNELDKVTASPARRTQVKPPSVVSLVEDLFSGKARAEKVD